MNKDYLRGFLYQLPEVVQLRLRCGLRVLDLYLKALSFILHHPVVINTLSTLKRFIYEVNTTGDFLIITDTSIISVSIPNCEATHHYLLSNPYYLENELNIRLKKKSLSPQLKATSDSGYVEEYLLSQKNIYSYIHDLGETTFFRTAVERMADLYKALPYQNRAIGEHIAALINDISTSDLFARLGSPPLQKLIDHCKEIDKPTKIKACTVHGDLKTDQFIYANQRLYVLDWEFSRISLPESDFVSLITSFDNLYDLLKNPEIFADKYSSAYLTLKMIIDCRCILSLKEMVAVYLLDLIWASCKAFSDFGLSETAFKQYVERRVRDVIDLLSWEEPAS
jgi:hypothetical protein